MHGGWGYGLNPFNRQQEKLHDEFRVICPDRSGYGRSTRLNSGFSINFHYRAAAETLSLLDALGIERAFFWGHSDGAVIAAIIGFTAPERVRGLILEAFHYYRMKPSSREFFETSRVSLKHRADFADDCTELERQLGELITVTQGLSKLPLKATTWDISMVADSSECGAGVVDHGRSARVLPGR